MQAVAVPRRWRIGAGTLLALVIAGAALTVVTGGPAAAVSPAAAGNDHTVKGYLSLQDSATFVGKECQGAGGYTDLVEGTPVVVRDGDGQVIGSGRFAAGRGTRTAKFGGISAPSACVFAFTLKHVPDAETYSFQMSHRGGVVYTREELEANNWRVGAALTPMVRAELASDV